MLSLASDRSFSNSAFVLSKDKMVATTMVEITEETTMEVTITEATTGGTTMEAITEVVAMLKRL